MHADFVSPHRRRRLRLCGRNDPRTAAAVRRRLRARLLLWAARPCGCVRTARQRSDARETWSTAMPCVRGVGEGRGGEVSVLRNFSRALTRRPMTISIAFDRDGQPRNLYFNAAHRHDRAVHELLGMIRGVLVDGIVTEDEARALDRFLL